MLTLKSSCSCWLLFLIVSSLPAYGQDEIKPLVEKTKTWRIAGDGGTETLAAELTSMKNGVLEFTEANGNQRSISLEELVADDRRAALIDRIGSGTVMISTQDVFERQSGFGSGFVFHPRGFILTNYHVISGAASVKVTFRDHDSALPASVMSVDPAHDIAVLQVEQLPADVHVVEIQSRELPTPGNSVWTLGHPNGLKNTAGWGQVSAIRKTAEMPEGLKQALKSPPESRWLQTTAVIAQGSSGGPLLNEDGEAIGINTFLLSPQLGFAVHISHARNAFVKAMQSKPLKLPFPPEQDEDALAWLSPEVAPLLQEYSEALTDLQRSAAGLSRAEAISKVNGIRDTYRERFLTLAKQDPESWPGLQALAYAAQTCSGDNDDDALREVCKIALEHHSKNQQISSILRMVAQKPGDAVTSFARSLVDESPHEVVRLSGCMTLAMNQLQRLQYPESVDLDSMLQSRQEVEDVCKQLELIAAESTQEKIKRDGKLLAEQLRQQLTAIQTGLPAPEISGVDSEGTDFKLSEYRGKVVLLDFFADWCPHCKRMYPAERKMVEDMKDRPFALLGIHCETEQVLQRLVNNRVVTWRCWADGEDGVIAASWSLEGFPTMVLLDETGRIRYRWNGVPDEKQLHDFVEELVSQAESDSADQ